MKTVFSIDTEIADDDLLVNVDAEVRQKLYDDTMKFFANLYGETTSEDTSTDTAEAGTDEIQKQILKMELQKKLTKDKKQRCKMRMSPLGRHPFCSFRETVL